MKKILFLKNRLIAHRGIHYQYKENTYEAFKQTIMHNYTIELDVHLSRDKEIVVYHDHSLNRLYKINKQIKDLSLKELKKYNIPTLKEVLELVSGKVPIIIEIKATNIILYKKIINLLDNYKGNFAIQSFFPKTILYFKKLRPNYVRGYLFYNPTKLNIIEKIVFNHYLLSYLLKPDFIGINKTTLNSKKIQSLRKKYLIIGYTINNEIEYLNYLKYADNFICNIPKGGLHQ